MEVLLEPVQFSDATCLNTNANRKWSICLYSTTEKLETNLTEPERKTHVAVFPLFLFEWEREWERL